MRKLLDRPRKSKWNLSLRFNTRERNISFLIQERLEIGQIAGPSNIKIDLLIILHHQSHWFLRVMWHPNSSRLLVSSFYHIVDLPVSGLLVLATFIQQDLNTLSALISTPNDQNSAEPFLGSNRLILSHPW
jgi:hypothetical protein